MSELRFAIPKGSLEERTFQLLREAGYKVSSSSRSYSPYIDDPEIKLRMSRPQEIPSLIAEGVYDLGISGIDWINETKANVKQLTDLEYGKVRIVVAIPESHTDVTSLDDLIEKFAKSGILRISTEYLNFASNLFSQNKAYQKHFGSTSPSIITPWYKIGDNPKVRISLSFGATESKPPREADAIVDNTETGSTLRANNLKIIAEPFVSTSRLIANPDALKDPFKREKILDIFTLLRGVVEARKKLHIFANVKEENLSKILEVLPALKSPTISKLSVPGWLSINTIIDRTKFIEFIPKLRKLAQGIIAYEPRQVLPISNADEVLRDEET